MNERITGIVKWFDPAKGYGFVNEVGKEDDYFFHYSYLEMEGYKSIAFDTPVEFELVETEKGLQAQKIKPFEETT